MKGLLVLALIAGGTWFYLSRPPTPSVQAAPPQVALQPASVSDAPLQRNPDAPAAFQVNGYDLRTLQAFSIKARVLSVEQYRIGRGADLSPVDVALG